MNCFLCKGNLVESTIKFIVDLGPCVVIVKNVPASVCSQCGEASFSDNVAKQLERIVNTVRNSIMTEVAIVEYSTVAA